MKRLSLDEYEAGVRARDRAVLARAITLVESRNDDDAALAEALLERLRPLTGGARRVGVTGVPGVGKSTFIDALGMWLRARGLTIAVLAVDPSSSISGGSILGDKTRMARLAFDEGAYIRPSPSGLTSGGVASRTREAMLLCEAAGFDVVLIETVGVGQGETAVAELVDCFVLLALAGAGDELQGIKKGVLELADIIAVNKADGDGAARAQAALAEYQAVMRFLPRKSPAWAPVAMAISGATGMGLEALWAQVEAQGEAMVKSGERARLRAEQQRRWLWTHVREQLEHDFRSHPAVQAKLAAMENEVVEGRLGPASAARALMAAFRAKE